MERTLGNSAVSGRFGNLRELLYCDCGRCPIDRKTSSCTSHPGGLFGAPTFLRSARITRRHKAPPRRPVTSVAQAAARRTGHILVPTRS